MLHSKIELWTILMPNTGKVETNTGSNAQWMAQAIEVAMPIISQLIFVFMVRNVKLVNLQYRCNFLILLHLSLSLIYQLVCV